MKIIIETPSVNIDLLENSDIAKITEICIQLEKLLSGRIVTFNVRR